MTYEVWNCLFIGKWLYNNIMVVNKVPTILMDSFSFYIFFLRESNNGQRCIQGWLLLITY